MSDRDFMHMRGVDDQLAPVCHDRFQLVHALAGDPEFVVHRRCTRQNLLERLRATLDVDFV